MTDETAHGNLAELKKRLLDVQDALTDGALKAFFIEFIDWFVGYLPSTLKWQGIFILPVATVVAFAGAQEEQKDEVLKYSILAQTILQVFMIAIVLANLFGYKQSLINFLRRAMGKEVYKCLDGLFNVLLKAIVGADAAFVFSTKFMFEVYGYVICRLNDCNDKPVKGTAFDFWSLVGVGGLLACLKFIFEVTKPISNKLEILKKIPVVGIISNLCGHLGSFLTTIVFMSIANVFYTVAGGGSAFMLNFMQQMIKWLISGLTALILMRLTNPNRRQHEFYELLIGAAIGVAMWVQALELSVTVFQNGIVSNYLFGANLAGLIAPIALVILFSTMRGCYAAFETLKSAVMGQYNGPMMFFQPLVVESESEYNSLQIGSDDSLTSGEFDGDQKLRL